MIQSYCFVATTQPSCRTWPAEISPSTPTLNACDDWNACMDFIGDVLAQLARAPLGATTTRVQRAPNRRRLPPWRCLAHGRDTAAQPAARLADEPAGEPTEASGVEVRTIESALGDRPGRVGLASRADSSLRDVRYAAAVELARELDSSIARNADRPRRLERSRHHDPRLALGRGHALLARADRDQPAGARASPATATIRALARRSGCCRSPAATAADATTATRSSSARNCEPHLQPTGMCLLALAGRSDATPRRRTVRSTICSGELSARTATASLCYGLLGLAAWQRGSREAPTTGWPRRPMRTLARDAASLQAGALGTGCAGPAHCPLIPGAISVASIPQRNPEDSRLNRHDDRNPSPQHFPARSGKSTAARC